MNIAENSGNASASTEKKAVTMPQPCGIVSLIHDVRAPAPQRVMPIEADSLESLFRFIKSGKYIRDERKPDPRNGVYTHNDLIIARGFRNNVRLNENALPSEYLLFDIDDGAPMRQAIDKIQSLAIGFIVYTTHSHQKAKGAHEPCDRYRIITQLDEAVLPSKGEYAAVAAALGLQYDTAAADWSRLNYLPAASAFLEFHPGKPFPFESVRGAAEPQRDKPAASIAAKRGIAPARNPAAENGQYTDTDEGYCAFLYDHGYIPSDFGSGGAGYKDWIICAAVIKRLLGQSLFEQWLAASSIERKNKSQSERQKFDMPQVGLGSLIAIICPLIGKTAKQLRQDFYKEIKKPFADNRASADDFGETAPSAPEENEEKISFDEKCAIVFEMQADAAECCDVMEAMDERIRDYAEKPLKLLRRVFDRAVCRMKRAYEHEKELFEKHRNNSDNDGGCAAPQLERLADVLNNSFGKAERDLRIAAEILGVWHGDEPRADKKAHLRLLADEWAMKLPMSPRFFSGITASLIDSLPLPAEEGGYGQYTGAGTLSETLRAFAACDEKSPVLLCDGMGAGKTTAIADAFDRDEMAVLCYRRSLRKQMDMRFEKSHVFGVRSADRVPWDGIKTIAIDEARSFLEDTASGAGHLTQNGDVRGALIDNCKGKRLIFADANMNRASYDLLQAVFEVSPQVWRTTERAVFTDKPVELFFANRKLAAYELLREKNGGKGIIISSDSLGQMFLTDKAGDEEGAFINKINIVSSDADAFFSGAPFEGRIMSMGAGCGAGDNAEQPLQWVLCDLTSAPDGYGSFTSAAAALQKMCRYRNIEGIILICGHIRQTKKKKHKKNLTETALSGKTRPLTPEETAAFEAYTDNQNGCLANAGLIAGILHLGGLLHINSRAMSERDNSGAAQKTLQKKEGAAQWRQEWIDYQDSAIKLLTLAKFTPDDLIAINNGAFNLEDCSAERRIAAAIHIRDMQKGARTGILGAIPMPLFKYTAIIDNNTTPQQKGVRESLADEQTIEAWRTWRYRAADDYAAGKRLETILAAMGMNILEACGQNFNSERLISALSDEVLRRLASLSGIAHITKRLAVYNAPVYAGRAVLAMLAEAGIQFTQKERATAREASGFFAETFNHIPLRLWGDEKHSWGLTEWGEEKTCAPSFEEMPLFFRVSPRALASWAQLKQKGEYVQDWWSRRADVKPDTVYRQTAESFLEWKGGNLAGIGKILDKADELLARAIMERRRGREISSADFDDTAEIAKSVMRGENAKMTDAPEETDPVQELKMLIKAHFIVHGDVQDALENPWQMVSLADHNKVSWLIDGYERLSNQRIEIIGRANADKKKVRDAKRTAERSETKAAEALKAAAAILAETKKLSRGEWRQIDPKLTANPAVAAELGKLGMRQAKKKVFNPKTGKADKSIRVWLKN